MPAGETGGVPRAARLRLPLGGLEDTRAEARAATQVRPALAPFLGKYRYVVDATGLVLTKVGSPGTVYRFTKGSYCSSEYDCNMARPDDACIINYSCNAQHSCDVVQQDPWCDASFRSVADLGDMGGTWTSSNAPSGAFVKLELSPSAPGTGTSNGSFKGTTSSGTVQTRNFAAIRGEPRHRLREPHAPARQPDDLLWVKGVKLSAANKVVGMQVPEVLRQRPHRRALRSTPASRDVPCPRTRRRGDRSRRGPRPGSDRARPVS